MTGRDVVAACPASRASSRTTATPLALSSAPGACGTVSRWAPTTIGGASGEDPGRRATRLSVCPAPTWNPADSPAGTRKSCRVTS